MDGVEAIASICRLPVGQLHGRAGAELVVHSSVAWHLPVVLAVTVAAMPCKECADALRAQVGDAVGLCT